jgi:hypothetical protein
MLGEILFLTWERFGKKPSRKKMGGGDLYDSHLFVQHATLPDHVQAYSTDNTKRRLEREHAHAHRSSDDHSCLGYRPVVCIYMSFQREQCTYFISKGAVLWCCSVARWKNDRTNSKFFFLLICCALSFATLLMFVFEFMLMGFSTPE